MANCNPCRTPVDTESTLKKRMFCFPRPFIFVHLCLFSGLLNEYERHIFLPSCSFICPIKIKRVNMNNDPSLFARFIYGPSIMNINKIEG